jgi:hypothetical protein
MTCTAPTDTHDLSTKPVDPEPTQLPIAIVVDVHIHNCHSYEPPPPRNHAVPIDWPLQLAGPDVALTLP